MYTFRYLDYASVVFVGFAAISAVWYFLSKSLDWFTESGSPFIQSVYNIKGGRSNFKGPPVPEEPSESKSF